MKEMGQLVKSRRKNGRKFSYVLENHRPAHLHRDSWKAFRKEMRMKVTWTQQKEAAAARVASGHTSHLGRMGTSGFRAIFMKDYGRPPTAEETRMATYNGYKKLKLTLPPPDAFELHGETNMEEITRQVAAGLASIAPTIAPKNAQHDDDRRDDRLEDDNSSSDEDSH